MQKLQAIDSHINLLFEDWTSKSRLTIACYAHSSCLTLSLNVKKQMDSDYRKTKKAQISKYTCKVSQSLRHILWVESQFYWRSLKVQWCTQLQLIMAAGKNCYILLEVSFTTFRHHVISALNNSSTNIYVPCRILSANYHRNNQV